MTVTVLVGAPGTLLSSAAARLANDDVSVFDVEAHLISVLTPDDRAEAESRKIGDQPLDMAAVTRAFPRHKVLELWRESLRSQAPLIRAAEGHAVITAHLTIYRGDRGEFYSTQGAVADELRKSGIEVDEVVQLIDDIYDMYVRLSGETGLSISTVRNRWTQFVTKSTPKNLRAGFFADGREQLHLEAEAKVQALELLLGWRHQESVAAEALAGYLDARFTVLGIKHALSSLSSLIAPATSPVKTIYVSHPISAYRRLVNARVAEGAATDEELWDEGVTECNELPLLIEADQTLVAVMPTAIDELRLQPLSSDAERLTERSPYLGPRWPLMDGGVGLVSTQADGSPLDYAAVQHRALLLDEPSPIAGQQFTGEITRVLESLVFNEIPYRDHLIVANSHALLVHRPLADNGRLSSGVEHEVLHWADRHRWTNPETRLAIIHRAEDLALERQALDGSGAWYESEADAKAAASNSQQAIEASAADYLADHHRLRSDEIRSVLRGQTLSPEQLGGRVEFSEQASVDRVWAEAIRVGVSTLLTNRLALIDEPDTTGVSVYLVSRGVRLTSTRMKVVRDFLAQAGAPATFAVTVIDDEGSQQCGSVWMRAAPILEEILGVDTNEIDQRLARELRRHPDAHERADAYQAAAADAATDWYRQIAQRAAD